MPGCCVPLCKNRSGGSGEKKYSFHRFPACQEKREQWLKLIRRDDFIPTANTRVCSWHFSDGFKAGPTRFHWNVSETTNADPMPAPSQYTKKKLRIDAEENGLEVLASAAQSQSSTDDLNRDLDPVILETDTVDGRKKRDKKVRKQKKQQRNKNGDCEKAGPTQEQSNNRLGQCTHTQSTDISQGETLVFLPLSEEDFMRRMTKAHEQNVRLKEDIERLKEKLSPQKKRKTDGL